MAFQGKKLIAIFIRIILITIHQNYYSCRASFQINHRSTTTQNNIQFNEMHQEKIDQLKIPKDQTLVVRLPSNTLLKYNSYKDVSILHFRVPPDTRKAMFTFKATEESKSAFQRKCKPQDVSLHLKASSYPVISPENITFPRNFLSSDERFKIYNLQFKSNAMENRITVEGPEVGNWFAVAFVSWTDPSNDRIEQQGLAASCDTLLLAEMSVLRFHPIIINNGQVHNSTLISNREGQHSKSTSNKNNNFKNRIQVTKNTQQHSSHEQKKPLQHNSNANSNFENEKNAKFSALDSNDRIIKTVEVPEIDITTQSSYTAPSFPYISQLTSKSNNKPNTNSGSSFSAITNNEVIYKFFVPRHVSVATARISFDHICLPCPDVGFHIQANAFPSTEEETDRYRIYSTIIKPNQTGEISVEFYVQPMNWHYILLKFVDSKSLIFNSFEGHVSSESKQNGQVRLKSSERLQQQKRQAMELTAEENGSTLGHRLTFTIQIDYQEPSESVVEKFKHNNELDKTNATNETTDSPKACDPKIFNGIEFYAVLRQTYREFFMYDFDLVPDENGTVAPVLNLTSGMPVGLAFEVGEVHDIGGTLSFAVVMKHDNKAARQDATKIDSLIPSTSELLVEKLIGRPDVGLSSSNDLDNERKKTEGRNLPRSNQTIIVCMHLGKPGVPTWPDKCRYGRHLLPASSIVNNTDLNTSTGLIHVPFPESGQWYVTMGLYCHGAKTTSRATTINSVKEFVRKYAHMLKNIREPCACATRSSRYQDCISDPDCLRSMSETETLKIKECLMDSKCTSNHIEMTAKFQVYQNFSTEQRLVLDNCKTSVVFTISSSPCVAGRCGRYGNCYHYMSGGFVFSTCICIKGYRGWDCTEDSHVPSSISILTASLLLTLSNLIFCPSIYVAGRRKFYTEAVIYFFAMFFSMFYHACDSGEDEYSFCLVKIGVLQFCDFYCGLLAIWVTLVAMSHVRQQFVSLLHMLGAIILAFGTEVNKQSLWVFLAPTLTGICIISASWGTRCYKSKKWFPTRMYLTVYMPLGTVLVMVGLVCYAFLQTKQNYHIVHSVWHMVMALSILCLLPSPKSFIPKC